MKRRKIAVMNDADTKNGDSPNSPMASAMAEVTLRLAHDIRNPLCAIMTAATQMKADLELDKAVTSIDDLDTILTAADSIETILNRYCRTIPEKESDFLSADVKE